jgi:hypothetical protein
MSLCNHLSIQKNIDQALRPVPHQARLGRPMSAYVVPSVAPGDVNAFFGLGNLMIVDRRLAAGASVFAVASTASLGG